MTRSAHNGSVVNNVELREQFIAEGMTVRSQNDGETCVHAVGRYINRGYQFIDAIRLAYGDLQGAYALVIGRTDEDKLYAFKKGSVKEHRSRCKRELRRELGGRYVKSGRPIQQHLW